MKTEPAVTLTTVLAVIVAGIGLLVEFGVDLTAGQQTAIITFASALGIVITGWLIRSRVTPVAQLGTSHAEREAARQRHDIVDPETEAGNRRDALRPDSYGGDPGA